MVVVAVDVAQTEWTPSVARERCARANVACHRVRKGLSAAKIAAEAINTAFRASALRYPVRIRASIRVAATLAAT
jgi:hypothetical protein